MKLPSLENLKSRNRIDADIIATKNKDNKIGFNDTIAYISVIKTSWTEIYTFDKHFDIFKEIKCVTK